MPDRTQHENFQWTSWAEAGDCDNEATETIDFHGETIEVCDYHARILRNRP